jgi:hypothetical protein
MRTSLLTIILFLSCLSLAESQKKYVVKIKTLDNKTHKGVLFHVENNGVLILPRKTRLDYKVIENNIPKALLVDFGTIKTIKIKKKDAIPYGAITGFFVGTAVGILSVKKKKSFPNDFIGINGGFSALEQVTTFSISLTGGALLGSGIDLIYPHIYNVKNDSTSIQNLKIKLKKYEWYKSKE